LNREGRDIEQETTSSRTVSHFLWIYALIGSLLLVLGIVLAALTVWRMASGILYADTALLSVSVIIIGVVAIYLGREFGKTSNPEKDLPYSSGKEENSDAHSH
jgi:membrane protein implicated in regulation of membrane protease activity